MGVAAYLRRHLNEVRSKDFNDLEEEFELCNGLSMLFVVQLALVVHEWLKHDNLQVILVAEIAGVVGGLQHSSLVLCQ